MTRRASITLRLTSLFAAVSATVLLALGYLIGETVERHFEEQDRMILTGKLELARHALSSITSAAGLDALPLNLGDALVGHHDLSIVVQGPRGQTLFATPHADFPAELLAPPSAVAKPSQETLVIWNRDDRIFRGLASAVPITLPEWSPVTVAVAADISHHVEFLAGFRKTLWWVVGVAVTLSALLGWAATRYGLAPLRDITRISREVSIDRLGERLRLDTVPLELKETATAFNDMLARLEDSFRRLTDFASDIAHELRTPIGNLMTQTHVTLAQARTVEDYREVLYSNAEELDRLARTISDMLFLAKADHGLIVPQREPVDLAREIAELIEFYGLAAHEQGVALRLDGTGSTSGDRLMLRRALGNLLSNAIRHTPRGGTIHVITESTADGAASVAIENPGADIAPEHLPRVFDRFYRADPSRQQSAEGAGLGLAITQSIIRAHGGRIDVTSSNGSTRFTITLPSKPTNID